MRFYSHQRHVYVIIIIHNINMSLAMRCRIPHRGVRAAVFQKSFPTTRTSPSSLRCNSSSVIGKESQLAIQSLVREGVVPDAVIVLGGGLRVPSDPTVQPLGDIPPWAVRRLDGAAQIRQSFGGNTKIAISGGGSPHGLPVIHPETGQVVHEGTAYAEYLIRTHGVPPLQILKESSSYDTVGNGYFSAMIHAVPSGWRNLIIVTSEFHMPRSRAIFEKVYSLVNDSVLRGNGKDIALTFAAVSDDGLFDQDPLVLEARKEKERESIATWKKNTDWMTSLHEFHEWFYATHLCYSCSRQNEFGVIDTSQKQDDRLKGTY